MNQQYLRAAINALLVVLWMPALAWAGSITLDKTIASVSPMVLVAVMVLSTLAGVTALLLRIQAELKASGGPLPQPWLFAAAHMSGSWLAGLLAFAIGEAGNMNDWTELIFVIVGSFLGAKFIEKVAEKYLPSAGVPVEGEKP